ncbi:MAG TPA: hypothetical protein VM490_13875 [Armatimonadaceae bacterium]|nr:hypothetical protein [Armatimonadaceae bacterium]
MPNDTPRRLLLAAAIPATIGVNALANIQRWGGVTTGDVSALYPTLITPASYAFLIWNVIYLGLLGFAAYQAHPARDADPALRSVRGPLLASCAANVAWIALWHQNLILPSLAAIVALAASLAVAFARLLRHAPVSTAERWLVHAPVSLYLGWVSVATVVNSAVAAVAHGAPSAGFAAEVGAALALIGGAFVGGVLASRRGDFVVALAVVWAYAAIIVAHSRSVVVVSAAVVGAVAVVAAALLARSKADRKGRGVGSRRPARA